MIVQPGPAAIQFRGRTIPRFQSFTTLHDVACPDGHRMKSGAMTILGDIGLTCTHRPAAGQGECGALIWLVQLPAPQKQTLWYYADVEYRELTAWRDASFTLEDILRYLGAWRTRGG